MTYGAVGLRVLEIRCPELSRLLQAVFESSGMDFRDYAGSSLERRVRLRLADEGLSSIAALTARIRSDHECLERLLKALTTPVTAMFRDPSFFRVFREEIVPVLRGLPFVRIWVAGCSTGEEAYSLAILLHEADLYRNCRIYATDVNEAALARAKEGVYPLVTMERYSRNYHEAKGETDLAEYYTVEGDHAVMSRFLRDNVLFAEHNLATDASFNEFHVILCRNVMIYFNRRLRARSERILHESLAVHGFLGLGRSESVRFSPHGTRYEPVSIREHIYRRVVQERSSERWGGGKRGNG